MSDEPGGTTKPKGGSRGDRAFQAFLMIACAALAVMTLLLAYQNRKLKQELSRPATPQMPPDVLKVGDRFPSLALLDEGGNPVPVTFGAGSGRTLLMFYSGTCPACRQTFPIWGALLQDPPTRARVYGVRIGPSAADMPLLPFPQHTPEDAGKSLRGKVPFVPATVILDAGGTVERIWFGVLSEEEQKELRDRIS